MLHCIVLFVGFSEFKFPNLNSIELCLSALFQKPFSPFPFLLLSSFLLARPNLSFPALFSLFSPAWPKPLGLASPAAPLSWLATPLLPTLSLPPTGGPHLSGPSPSPRSSWTRAQVRPGHAASPRHLGPHAKALGYPINSATPVPFTPTRSCSRRLFASLTVAAPFCSSSGAATARRPITSLLPR
jgi:hypothetical protein